MNRMAPPVFRVWAFVASAPLGALLAFALPRPPSSLVFFGLCAAAGVLGAVLASLAARRGDDAPDRAAHVARGACAGLVALPAVAAAALRLGPPAWAWLALAFAALALALWRASRVLAPAPGAGGWLVSALGAPLAGALAVVVIAALYGVAAPAPPRSDETLRAAALDVDSRVAVRAPAACAPRVASTATLLERGSGPRLAADGATVWFEARAEDGRSQVYRLAPGGAPMCWTCAEPGNNRRPAPHPAGNGVLFDTDRFASWRSPADTELMLARVGNDEAPRHAARRLTVSPGPDDHALWDPSGAGVVWSHGGDGRFEVRRASLLSGHGAVLLSEPLRLFRGGSGWVAALAWAPDARTLVAGFGQPLAPLAGVRLDPASGERRRVEGGLVPGSVSFAADGRTMAVASTHGAGAARLLPASLGNLLARWPRGGEARAADTRVAIGPVDGALLEVALGDVAGWGAPTGLALLPDARGFVLGQRGPAGERIVRIDLDCAR